MTWTYSGDPNGSTKDAIRFLVGDTDQTDQLAQDEEINYVLANEGALYAAAATVADAIAAKFSRKADKQVGDLKISASQQAAAYRQRAVELRTKVALGVAPVAGGLSQSAKDSAALDTDLVRPALRRGIMDNQSVSPVGTDASSLRGW